MRVTESFWTVENKFGRKYVAKSHIRIIIIIIINIIVALVSSRGDDFEICCLFIRLSDMVAKHVLDYYDVDIICSLV